MILVASSKERCSRIRRQVIAKYLMKKIKKKIDFMSIIIIT